MSLGMDFCNEVLQFFESEIQKWCEEKLPANELSKAMCYSLRSGGKRFRPVLSFLTAEAFGVAPTQVLGWAMAIEMVHTYSLIHDDLPCMDDDDLRRGQPTNHKVFGEHIALLAGDALMTEAFGLIAEKHPTLTTNLVRVLAEACGVRGMVCGQTSDLRSKIAPLSFQDTLEMQNQKTGALIRASIEGSAVLCGLPTEKIVMLREFGSLLGLSFQLRDDLLDSSSQIEAGSFPALIGREKTQSLLVEKTTRALEILSATQLLDSRLHKLVDFNFGRAI